MPGVPPISRTVALSPMLASALPMAAPTAPAEGNGAAALVDRFGRVASDLRISLTDRCNLRCTYCMPAAGLPWQPREEHLTGAEIVSLVERFAALGVRSVRLTGGEPLLRRDLAEIVAAIRGVDGIEDVALTTNGVLLERRASALAAAGGARLNVSIDSADRAQFASVTRRDDLDRVLAGLREAARYPELTPIKLNAVALAGVAEGALDGLLAVAASVDAELRFIEPMPLDADRAWTPEDGVSGERLRQLLRERGRLLPVGSEPSATATRYELRHAMSRRAADPALPVAQTIGLIASVTEPFCASCDRLRLTADGQLRSCLFSKAETDLRGPLRAGACGDELDALIRGAVWRKPAGHGIDSAGFEPPERPMSAIGG